MEVNVDPIDRRQRARIAELLVTARTLYSALDRSTSISQKERERVLSEAATRLGIRR